MFQHRPATFCILYMLAALGTIIFLSYQTESDIISCTSLMQLGTYQLSRARRIPRNKTAIGRYGSHH
jgi:hypothetical protein